MFPTPGTRAGRAPVITSRAASWRNEAAPSYVPLAGDFAWVNQGSATVTDTDRGVVLSCPNAAAASLKCLVRAVPAGAPYDVYLRQRPQSQNIQFTSSGLCLRNSGSGRLITFNITQILGTPTLELLRWASATAFGGSVTSLIATVAPLWHRFNVSATTITAYYSYDGINWATLGTEALASYITSVDQAGFFANPQGGIGRMIAHSFDFQAPN